MNNFKQKKLDIFLKFLNFYWLRPEKALLHTLRAEKYIATFRYFKGRTLDVSCGDGVFSFFALGGALNDNCDQYQSLKTSKIYSMELNEDLYDSFNKKDYKLSIKKKPKVKYTMGTDYKKNLIEKSRKLNLYKKFLLHDNNKSLPDNIGQFDYIYANSAYWVGNFEHHIKDLVDKSNKNGKIILSLKGNELSKNNFLNKIKNIFGNDAYKILDRGRRESWKGLKNYNYYITFLKSIKSCKIEKITPIFDRQLLNIWDIGLRPLFKPLTILLSKNKKNNILKSKKLFIKIIFEIFKKYLTNYNPKKQDAVEWLIVLSKK